MNQGPVAIFGGTGFLGGRLCEHLTVRGIPVRPVARHAGCPAPLVEHVVGDLRDPAVQARAVEGARAVVNLVGTTSAETEQEFFSLHCEAPRGLAQLAQEAGVQRLVHVSAMGIDDGVSAADRSKAAGERAVREAFPSAVLMRPSLVFGPRDHFFARFGRLVRTAPAIPLIGGGRTLFQPMHVDDVALAMLRALERPDAPGKTYELGGGEVLSLRALLERLCRALQRRPWLVPVPFAAAEALAWLSQHLPGAPLTVDQVRLLKTDKVVLDWRRAPAALGVAPRPLDEFLATLAAQSRQPI